MTIAVTRVMNACVPLEINGALILPDPCVVVAVRDDHA
jgi:hypothetical protein